MARTIDDLRQMQALPLSLKVSLTKARIRQWVNEYGEDGVYISFSGGKDSTVLLHIVREMYPDIPAVFVNTGLEYPEIVQFVKTFDNVEIIRPKMNFKKVIEKCGYPFISKEVSGAIQETRTFLEKIRCSKTNVNAEEINSEFLIRSYNQKEEFGYEHKMPVRVLQMIGKMPHKKKGVYTGEISQLYDKSKWLFMVDAPFAVSNHCCHIMKKTQ